MSPDANNVGYDDTPILPGTDWHVHDGHRPQPPIVTPGEMCSDDILVGPPSDAVVLFDGTDLSGWVSTATGEPAAWDVQDGYMQVALKTGYIETKEHFGDCQLHVEFACPEEVKGDSQGRGNSGVFLMGEYEIQVLDCFDNPTYPDGTVGGIYGQFPPLANACRKPGQWQTDDIIWAGPRFDGEELVRPAFVTVILNGILLHYRKELLGVTSHRVLTEYSVHAEVGPLKLQDHGDLVRFRNIWYRPLAEYDAG
jgi:hypothetical protein